MMQTRDGMEKSMTNLSKIPVFKHGLSHTRIILNGILNIRELWCLYDNHYFHFRLPVKTNKDIIFAGNLFSAGTIFDECKRF